MIQYIRSAIFNILFLIETTFFSILATLSICFPKGVLIKIAYIWSYTSLVLLKHICHITYDIKGKENIPSGKHVIFASKHQSAWETIAYQYLLKNCIFMFKKELAFIPFFGITLIKAGNIMVDRGNANKKTLNNLVKKFKKALKVRNVIIFPEGTRTKPHTTPKYKSGLSIISQQLNDTWVVPIAMNAGEYWPKHGFLKKQGVIKVRILPPISTNLDKEEFQEKLVSSIENEMKKL